MEFSGNAAGDEAIVAVSEDAEADGLVIQENRFQRTQVNLLIVAGHSKRGGLLGVYEQLGGRWPV